MAQSGTINLGTLGSNKGSADFTGRIKWSAKTSGRSSTVTLTLQVHLSDGYTYATVDGNVYAGEELVANNTWGFSSYLDKTWVEVASGSVTVKHNSAGNASLSISGSATIRDSGSFGGTITGSGIATLDNIGPDHSASSITGATNATLGGTSKVSWNAQAGLHYKIFYTRNGATHSETFYRAAAGPTYAEVTMDYDIAYDVTDARTKIVTLYMSTHTTSACDSSDRLGTSNTDITVTVPDDDNTKPTVTGADYRPDKNPFSGAYIQGYNGIKVNSISADGKYGASITRTFFRVEGKNYNTGATSDDFIQNGYIQVAAYAVDSRGIESRAHTFDVYVIPYSPPKIKPPDGYRRVQAIRCDRDKRENDKGAYLILMAKREYSPVTFNQVQRNYCVIQYRYKAEGGGAWSAWVTILEAGASGDAVVTGPLIGTLAPTSGYRVEVQALDSLGNTGVTKLFVSSDRIFDHADGGRGSYAFGKYIDESDSVDIAQDKTVIIRGQLDLKEDALAYLVNLAHPVGSVLETSNATNPGEYLGGTWTKMTEADGILRWRRLQ